MMRSSSYAMTLMGTYKAPTALVRSLLSQLVFILVLDASTSVVVGTWLTLSTTARRIRLRSDTADVGLDTKNAKDVGDMTTSDDNDQIHEDDMEETNSPQSSMDRLDWLVAPRMVTLMSSYAAETAAAYGCESLDASRPMVPASAFSHVRTEHTTKIDET